jgi:hypothetical protein
MDLCHLENSQMGQEFWKYKGRIVFRGDIVKNQDGPYAVFTEQDASASHMAAARAPGNYGEDSGAVGAYTQVRFADAPKLLGKPVLITDTWVKLPPHRRPKSWEHIQDPVCPLNLNLYPVGWSPLGGASRKHFDESRF